MPMESWFQLWYGIALHALVNYTPYIWLGAISVGLCSGASGIVTAHELGIENPLD